MRVRRLAEWLAIPLALAAGAARAQQAALTVRLDSGVQRLAGVDAASQIQYVRLILPGVSHSPKSGSAVRAVDAQAGAPMLIAQCTQRGPGKYGFELYMNFGDTTDLAFHPPWTASTEQPFEQEENREGEDHDGVPWVYAYQAGPAGVGDAHRAPGTMALQPSRLRVVEP